MTYAGDYEVLESYGSSMKVVGSFSTRKRALEEARLRARTNNNNFMQVVHVPSGKIIWEKLRHLKPKRNPFHAAYDYSKKQNRPAKPRSMWGL